MRIDIYHLYQHVDYANAVYPLIVDVLKVWAQSSGWEARVSVCREVRVDIDTDADVVAFSVFTQTAPAAYRLSATLRQRGKLVILGGPHFRGANNAEGLDHCDVLVYSICQQQWTDLLRAIERRQIRAGSGGQALSIVDRGGHFRYPDNFYSTFESQSWWQLPSIPTSLGCPYDCSFCNPFMQGAYLLRPLQIVYNELARVPKGRPIFFADATFGLHKRYTMDLMKAIAPLRRSLLIQSTLTRLQDEQLLDALAEGGVKWISIGIESLNSDLNKLGPGSVRESISRLLDQAHEREMVVEGNFICGLDSDGPGVFDEIYEFYENSSLDLIIVDVLTPYPNTRLFDQLKSAGRIIDADWEHYDYQHLVFRPLHMSANQLIDGYTNLYKSLYSPSVMGRKLKAAYSMAGFGTQLLGMMTYDAWSYYDARRKEKAFADNRPHAYG